MVLVEDIQPFKNTKTREESFFSPRDFGKKTKFDRPRTYICYYIPLLLLYVDSEAAEIFFLENVAQAIYNSRATNQSTGCWTERESQGPPPTPRRPSPTKKQELSYSTLVVKAPDRLQPPSCPVKTQMRHYCCIRSWQMQNHHPLPKREYHR